ncbi:holo-ACP synthase [Heliorestis acidaminivorans]|nr:holo-ACP synthase [Heliorestis acidaminivorans]
MKQVKISNPAEVSFHIGCDIVEIQRIQKAAERHSRFLSRIFTIAEIEECQQKADPWPSYAARFAAKEAVIKAMPGDFIPAFTDIEVTRQQQGKPQLLFRGNTQAYLESIGWKGWSVSLSHEKSHAMAVVLSWREGAKGVAPCEL